MGIVEIDKEKKTFFIHSHLITYGNAATPELTEQIRDEIETMWNEPHAFLMFESLNFDVVFRITAAFHPLLTELEVYQNMDARNNYFRIEEFTYGNISFVDGLGSNSGYLKLENLYKGSTTAAHEYGHTLGLDHPKHLDIRGQGVPGIMYPRGTLVDSLFQYDPNKPAGVTGGTMHPMYRKVRQQDVDDLKLHKLNFENGKAMLGKFTNIYHWNHAEIPPEEFAKPVVSG
ncbi:MAG: peptidase M10 [Chitinophagaceae bacterium]